MAITLAEASKLAQDVMLQGVIETIVKDDPLLEMLPFIPIVGNGLTCNREKTAATATWYDVVDTWTEDTPTFEQITATLRIVGGDADVDNFLRQTRINVQDLETEIIQLKAKAVRDEIRSSLITGNNLTNAKQPDGIARMIPAAQEVYSNGITAGNGATLSMDTMDRLIDKPLLRRSDVLLMSKRSRRKLNNPFRATGSGVLPTERTDFGNLVQLYDTIPVIVSDYIVDTNTVGSSTDCNTIYALALGPGAFAGLASTEELIIVERIGSLETKDASRTRVKAYIAWALFNDITCAKLTGVRD